MIEVSTKVPPRDNALKARRIVSVESICLLTGPPRHLRKIKEAVEAEGLSTFLGDADDGRTILRVSRPGEESGGILRSRIPEGAPRADRPD